MTADIDVTKPHWADRQVNRIFSNGWLKNGKKIHRTRDQCQNHGDHSGPTCEGLPNNQTYSQQQCFLPAPMASPGLETIFQFNRRQHGIIKPTQPDGSLDAGSTAHALFLETFFETTTMEIWWNMCNRGKNRLETLWQLSTFAPSRTLNLHLLQPYQALIVF